jgi:hypothetical protein
MGAPGRKPLEELKIPVAREGPFVDFCEEQKFFAVFVHT